jgi:hypothetical protein
VPDPEQPGSEQHRHDQRSEHPPAHTPPPRGVLANWGRVDLAGLAALEPIDLRIGRQVPVGAGDGEHGGDGQPAATRPGGPDGSTLARSRLSSRLTKRDLYQHVNGGLRRTGPAVNVGGAGTPRGRHARSDLRATAPCSDHCLAWSAPSRTRPRTRAGAEPAPARRRVGRQLPDLRVPARHHLHPTAM